MGRAIQRFIFVTCLLMLTLQSVYAYIDPGTGSYVLQAIAAGVLAALFVIKGFWRNIKESVGRLVRKRK